MERILNFKKGDKAVMVVEPTSNKARRLLKMETVLTDWFEEIEIQSVSKKYITSTNGKKFVIADDYREKYLEGGADYKLYESKEKWLEEQRKKHLKEAIIDLIKNDINEELSTDLLEKIYNLLKS